MEKIYPVALSLPVPALLVLPGPRSIYLVLDVRVPGAYGRGFCCWLSLLLRADSHPAFITHLKPSCF